MGREKSAGICNSERVVQFLDEEMEAGDSEQMRAHIETCAACGKLMREYRELSSFIQSDAENRLLDRPVSMERIILQKISGEQKRSLPGRMLRTLFTEKIWIPATAMATAGVLFLALNIFSPKPVSGPSAIVDSLSGNVSSIMIIEAPETRQTIIWYEEMES